jgi:dihydrodipicolinate synthase/N-acetylneuraminate lyase
VVTGAKAQQKVNTERTKRQQEQQVQAGINSLLSEDIGEQ